MNLRTQQLSLPLDDMAQAQTNGFNGTGMNTLAVEDRAFHSWYRFVLSFPPHLVRHYMGSFDLNPSCTVLDPFCGTGTTIVEARLNRVPSIGLEANPFPHFASRIKATWEIDPEKLRSAAGEIAHTTRQLLLSQGIDDRVLVEDSSSIPASLRQLNPDQEALVISDSISPLPLHKTLLLRDQIAEFSSEPYYGHLVLALGDALAYSIGNLRFGPEVGVGKKKPDAPVTQPWLARVEKMAADIESLQSSEGYPSAELLLADARDVNGILRSESVDAVITSPPYPNEKDYTRTTRLESVLLGFYSDKQALRTHKQRLLRSNTRGVYKADTDDEWVKSYSRIQGIADQIEAKRIRLGKSSGFERLYSRVTRLYFGGMARHLAELRPILRPGAQLAYVVGDQASYLQVMIRTGQLLAEIAQDLGYDVQDIELFRTRFATATGEELREEVVVLKWPGKRGNPLKFPWEMPLQPHPL